MKKRKRETEEEKQTSRPFIFTLQESCLFDVFDHLPVDRKKKNKNYVGKFKFLIKNFFELKTFSFFLSYWNIIICNFNIIIIFYVWNNTFVSFIRT